MTKEQIMDALISLEMTGAVKFIGDVEENAESATDPSR
jgi:hypothetical protein